ncbi:hypothetical protein DY000_02052670 [Brassica cretica]|uniref:Uncharacterized protein n=1 Tax=Brassica cretica TaxID=69181 RepID=A0ABQ7AHI1_BRACR|nr:hypothetical protein DY000_02052670 [Brassica cretica]
MVCRNGVARIGSENDGFGPAPTDRPICLSEGCLGSVYAIDRSVNTPGFLNLDRSMLGVCAGVPCSIANVHKNIFNQVIVVDRVLFAGRSTDRRTVFMSLSIPCEYLTIDRSILIEFSVLDSQRRSLSIDRSDLDVGIFSDSLSGARNEANDGVTGGGVKA